MAFTETAPLAPGSAATCLVDEDGVISAWSAGLARITGLEREEVLGSKWAERVVVRDRRGRRLEAMDIVGSTWEGDLEVVGRDVRCSVSITSAEMQSDDASMWVMVVRDATAERDLQTSRSEFLSTVSHELRTPLTAIRGALQMLSRPKASGNAELAKEMLQILKRGSERLERLVMNLLSVSEMEAGDLQVSPDEVDLEALVRSRIDSILLDHPQVELSGESGVIVRGDRQRLAQVVEHVLGNARKFGPASGVIRIEIATDHRSARLSVTDEGPGIAEADRDRIFDRFVRLDDPRTRETKGTGVGLFIAKRSLEAMGGSIEVESEPNRGATFHVRLPLARPTVASGPAPNA